MKYITRNSHTSFTQTDDASNRKAYFIIEEPESHLFPETQKKIMQFIAAVKNNGNEILVTTHSPYILGELNNLLYANNISGKVPKGSFSMGSCKTKRCTALMRKEDADHAKEND